MLRGQFFDLIWSAHNQIRILLQLSSTASHLWISYYRFFEIFHHQEDIFFEAASY
jgi:hypothetical protein